MAFDSVAAVDGPGGAGACLRGKLDSSWTFLLALFDADTLLVTGPPGTSVVIKCSPGSTGIGTPSDGLPNLSEPRLTTCRPARKPAERA